MILVICCFGLKKKIDPEYDKYLDLCIGRAVDRYALRSGKTVTVIVSGGRTDQRYPRVSAAETVASYIIQELTRQLGKEADEISIILEEGSFTIPANMVKSMRLLDVRRIIDRNSEFSYDIVFFTDVLRVPMVNAGIRWLRKWYEKDPARIRFLVEGCERTDNSRPNKWKESWRERITAWWCARSEEKFLEDAGHLPMGSELG
ncbi:MAG: hypothetical protein R3B38_00025 [Patescibacteria group bacterium]